MSDFQPEIQKLKGMTASLLGDRFVSAAFDLYPEEVKTALDVFSNPDSSADETKRASSFLKAVTWLASDMVVNKLRENGVDPEPRALMSLALRYTAYSEFRAEMTKFLRDDNRRSVETIKAFLESAGAAITKPALSAPAKIEEGALSPGPCAEELNPPQVSPPPETAPIPGQNIWQESRHAYGAKGALTFDARVTRKNEFIAGVNAAWAIQQRNYDWANKINLQFNSDELPLVLCVLYGFMKQVTGNSHGGSRDKQFSIENQGKHFYVLVSQGAETVAVQMTLQTAFWIRLMLTKGVCLATGVTEQTLIFNLEQLAKQISNAKSNH